MNKAATSAIGRLTLRPAQHAVICLAAGLFALNSAQAAQEEPWMVRVRAVHMDMANKSDPIPALGVTDPNTVNVSNKTIPEVDISYFFTPNWATELVLTYPQKQNLRSGALDAKVGTLKHLPPTLSLQYHLTGLPGWRPYAGVGVNYTRFSSVDLPAGVDIQRNSVGPAVGAGFDVPLGDGWLLNVDAKKVWIDTKVSVSGSRIGTFNVDPWLLGIGIGRRF